MNITNKDQQHVRRSDRGCLFLSIIWIVLNVGLFQSCVYELRTLKATRNFLLEHERQQQQLRGTVVSSPDLVDSSGRSSVVNPEQDVPSFQHATSSLLDVVREAANDGLSQISKAAQTGLIDSVSTPIKKGHLILHLGPSKTATTSLQADLTTVAEDLGWLGHDNFHFAGRYYRPYVSNTTGTLVMNRSESKLLQVARDMFRDADDRVDCSAFRHELETVYEERLRVTNPIDDDVPPALQTIILSDEAFGNMWLDPAFYETIRDAVSDEWNVNVVVAYRRLFEWILSSKFQRDRTDRTSAGGKERWPSEGGRALLPVFPDTLENDQWRQWYHYTDTILDAVGTTFPVRMINLHTNDDASILTQFLCQVLEKADFACAQSRERDLLGQTVLNTQENAAVPSLYYDALATAAAEAGWIDEMTHNRQTIRNAIRIYQEETLGLTSDDFPKECPLRDELAGLYQRSLEMERIYMPSLLAGYDEDGELNHHDAFKAKVAENSFCWVDAAAILLDPQWQQFLGQFSATA